MQYECAMIIDLLPLYADGVCSKESKNAVEAHLLECESCRDALEQMRAEIPEGDTPEFSAQEILKKTSWRISKRAVMAAVGVMAIVLYWLIYVWEEALADVGDYRYFSYRFHEVYGIGYLFVPLATVIWLIVLLLRSNRTGAWRRNIAIVLILVLLTVGQFVFWHRQSQLVAVSCVSEVVEIPDHYHVVIETTKGYVTLETTPSVTKLLKTDGTRYQFVYNYDKRDWDDGVLRYASHIAD